GRRPESRERERPDFSGGRLGPRGGSRACAPRRFGLGLPFRLRLPPPLRLRHRLLPCLRRRHLDEVTHLVEHAPERRMVRLHHAVLMMLQSQRLERAPLERRPPDSRAHLADPQRESRSEEHTSELQSLRHLVCRLLLEKKKKKKNKKRTKKKIKSKIENHRKNIK